ncbi:MAG TPA: serine/threonine-protein kinase [Gaiellaceae bacterium]|nr:serine/threonine-protein kinase [Gaiellaceae bacterium]
MANALAKVSAPDLALGRYRPLRPLGSGGSGSVWLARDERTGLDVALKIVPREGKAGQRAEREAEAAARLRHPGCLRAYAYGREGGHVYIAYEYAPGRTLREALRAGELPDADAIEACARLAEALAHAHSRGVVHRDVKPANVLLADGPALQVRLLDFGLAAFAEAETLTAAGDVPGTLAYISPERLAGEQGTAAGDVWAVGVVLWEALAGRHPFWRPSLLATGSAIEQGAPPLAAERPDLPERLLAAVDRALAVEPRKRPSAAALADALREARPRARGRVSNSLLLTAPAARFAWAATAGVIAGGAATLLPFWPVGFAPLFVALAFGIAFLRPRLGMAAALGAAVFPLGNLALGLALAFGAAAPAWLALTTAGPRALRRATLTASVVVAAHGLGPLDVAGEDSPVAAARTVLAAVPPQAWAVAVALGAAAATLPLARTPWRASLWGAGLLAALLLPTALPTLPIVAAVWAASAVLALRAAT